jgi:hypothetical protein
MEPRMNYPPGPTGCMISYATWEHFIRASDGSDKMKTAIIDWINERRGAREDDLLDSFKLGYELGILSTALTKDELRDFYRTIKLTRDLNNVPIVRRHGEPVA